MVDSVRRTTWRMRSIASSRFHRVVHSSPVSVSSPEFLFVSFLLSLSTFFFLHSEAVFLLVKDLYVRRTMKDQSLLVFEF